MCVARQQKTTKFKCEGGYSAKFEVPSSTVSSSQNVIRRRLRGDGRLRSDLTTHCFAIAAVRSGAKIFEHATPVSLNALLPRLPACLPARSLTSTRLRE